MRRDAPEGKEGKIPKILLLGNSQVGKTALWSELREGRRFTHRPEGDIMEIRRSLLTLEGKPFEVMDVPGVQSLALDTEEARLIKKLLLEERPSILLLVADAKNVKRGVMLFLEALELGLPVVIALNMSDEARQRGISVDVQALSSSLGIEACLTSSLEGEGISALRRSLARAKIPPPRAIYPGIVQRGLEDLEKELDGGTSGRFLGSLLLAGDPIARRYVASGWGVEKAEALEKRVEEIQSQFSLPLSLVMAEARLRAGEEISERITHTGTSRKVPFAETIDHWIRTPFLGFVAFAAILVALFLFVGKFGAGTLGGLLQDRLFGEVVVPGCTSLVGRLGWPFLERMLVGRFGLVSMGLASGLGIILPVLGTFFLVLSLLEDSGYVGRLGILFHRLFRYVGLNGKAVLTLFLGFSCVTMATLATRSLDSKKERLIAILLLGLGIPCSAQLSVIFAMTPMIPLSALLFVFLVIGVIELGMGLISNRVIAGAGSDFLMEIFPLRVPRMRDMLIKTGYRLFWFLREGIPLFLLGTLILFLCDEVGLLQVIERVGRPVVTGLFGLPPETTGVFMMGFIRKEGSVGVLKQLASTVGLNHAQIVISLILTTLFIPCINTILAVLKQEGLKNTLFVVTTILLLSIAVGGTLHHVLDWLQVTF